jgi:hypothetical protein
MFRTARTMGASRPGDPGHPGSSKVEKRPLPSGTTVQPSAYSEVAEKVPVTVAVLDGDSPPTVAAVTAISLALAVALVGPLAWMLVMLRLALACPAVTPSIWSDVR